jgi:hypothetical protein
MIRYQDLQILDYVLVDSKIRRVEALTKRKVGYHIKPEDQLHYARLQDVFPIEIKELRIEGLNIYINNDITLEFKCGDFEIENFNHTIKVSNCFDESVILREWHLHLLQHIFKVLDIKYTINIKNNLEL